MRVKLRPGDVKESIVVFVKVDPLTKANFFCKSGRGSCKIQTQYGRIPHTMECSL